MIATVFPTGFAAAQSVTTDTAAVAERDPLGIGLYVGELFKTGIPEFFLKPQDTQLSPSYLAALNIDYRFYKFEGIPLQLEGEVDIGKRFRGAKEYDIATVPLVRWMSFPWNRLLYTNVRAGLLGFSYATGISAWERENSGNDKGSHLLQFLVTEITFAGSENSRSEAFIRVHHRSGDFGLFDGVAEGSNYLAMGYRIFW